MSRGGLVFQQAARTSVDPSPLTPAQQNVYAVLRRLPGATIQDVARELGLGHTTATYHLNCLTERGSVHRERDGRAMRHFLTQGASARTTYVDALMRDDRKRRIINHLASGRADGCTVNKLAKSVKLPYGFVRRTLNQLVERGYVDVVRHTGWHQVRTRDLLHVAMARHERRQTALYEAPVARPSAPAPQGAGPAGVTDFHR